ncbi:MAG: alpha/beta hydrolase [Tetragenococcus halophilus]|uniref:alpha/beta hydrolase n=1 Tax=Tetragenococcus halophilus TaxID=51669 RepID=UPI000CBD4210|nr:alpha/beta hydrolase [Tetragenococcus halophilus]MDN5811255.1 alpha/beta hydrolase [Tetragenococcus koreensis]MDN6113375.1 alpha/beta hydrolase [Tetragenococcus halophilus]MDN6141563.1 alpha/beta hydrolase [Tetragenococcus halophilus]MDN6153214.1 alpha/beta hydrolase [Tetragenococcus halophilus]MDN6185912.1 alpha/beta hydrolase [Tetragenococcus halophilus]
MKKRTKQVLSVVILFVLIVGGLLYWGFSSREETSNEIKQTEDINDSDLLTVDSTIDEVIHHPAFGDFGEQLLPRPDDDTSLNFNQIDQLMPYHNHVSPEDSLESVNRMIDDAKDGQDIFYRFYSEDEIEEDPDKAETGLFYFRGEEGAPCAVISPGGGFSYVGSLHEGFPYAEEISDQGLNAFVINYRTGSEQEATEDLAQAISFIQENRDTLAVSSDNYSLWGSSAGARMAANIGTDGVSNYGGENIDKPATVVTAYTGHQNYSEEDVPTFAVVSRDDPIASSEVMEERIENLQENDIPADILVYDSVGHGFGLGSGTEAEGWLDEAISFWEEQMDE